MLPAMNRSSGGIGLKIRAGIRSATRAIRGHARPRRQFVGDGPCGGQDGPLDGELLLLHPGLRTVFLPTGCPLCPRRRHVQIRVHQHCPGRDGGIQACHTNWASWRMQQFRSAAIQASTSFSPATTATAPRAASSTMPNEPWTGVDICWPSWRLEDFHRRHPEQEIHIFGDTVSDWTIPGHESWVLEPFRAQCAVQPDNCQRGPFLHQYHAGCRGTDGCRKRACHERPSILHGPTYPLPTRSGCRQPLLQLLEAFPTLLPPRTSRAGPGSSPNPCARTGANRPVLFLRKSNGSVVHAPHASRRLTTQRRVPHEPASHWHLNAIL